MEASTRKRSGRNYTIATQQELNKLLQKKKYQMVQSQADQSDRGSQPVYLVPLKFPFIFSVSARDLGAEHQLARFDDIFRKINTFRRVQVVRSSIPRKIIFTNHANHDGKFVGVGKFGITLHHPLSDRLIESPRNFEFALLQNKKHQCAVIDIDAISRDAENYQVTLTNNCTVLQITIAFAQYAKTQRFIFFFKPFNTIKVSDLFYCLVKLNSSLTIKLYFLPEGPLTSSESHQLIPQQVRFNLSKVQIESGSPAKEESLLSKGSFISAARRAQQQASDLNYRINMVKPDPRKQYLPFDSFSAKLLQKLDQSRTRAHDFETAEWNPPRPQPIETASEIKRDLAGLYPLQFFSKNILRSAEPLHYTAAYRSESITVAAEVQNHDPDIKTIHLSHLTNRKYRASSSQQVLPTSNDQPLSASEANHRRPPAQHSVEQTKESEEFLAHRAGNLEGQQARLITSETEKKEEQGLEIFSASLLGPGSVGYEFHAEVVCSRGDPIGSLDSLNKPSSGLHAPQIQLQIISGQMKPSSICEQIQTPSDLRLRSDSSAQLGQELRPRAGSN
jgi:hypothetical protein